VTYVAGLTDRYAFYMAVRHLDWSPKRLPHGIDRDA
jgi:dGTPase